MTRTNENIYEEKVCQEKKKEENVIIIRKEGRGEQKRRIGECKKRKGKKRE